MIGLSLTNGKLATREYGIDVIAAFFPTNQLPSDDDPLIGGRSRRRCRYRSRRSPR
jgi:hypothetical protein